MAVAAKSLMVSLDRKRERADMDRKRKEFDEAVEDLRRAKQRFERATDMYLERLEGTRHDDRDA